MQHASLAFAEPLVEAPLALSSALAGVQALDPRALAAGEAGAVGALTDLLLALLSAFDAAEDEAWAAAAALTPAVAEHSLTLLILSRFPDGSGDTATLDDATVLLLVALTAAAGRADDALALLAGEAAQRRTPAFLRASWDARARLLTLPATLDRLWVEADMLSRTAAQLAIDSDPLDTRAHRALGRRLAEAGCLKEAVGVLARGLALPLPALAKAGIAADLAVLAVVAASTGGAALLAKRRLTLSLAADPAHARHALAALDAHPTLAALADLEALAAVRALFADHAAAAPGHAAPFPRRDGKTHLNMTFLEITNHCNQKCTFCPDMHRADARTWLPLDRVLGSIDELAEGFSMNMMQLNAYGEPLLHPQIGEILAHIRAKKLPWPTFFTTHGLTLVDKKLKALSHNYPTGIAVSLHNDSQQSYAATRNNRIGAYDTMVARVSALMRQMAHEGADCHLRLYMMVQNAHEDPRVPPEVRHAFPDSPERMGAHVRKWEAIAHGIAAAAPHHVHARALSATAAEIERAWRDADNDCGIPIPILEWRDANGVTQQAFMSARPLETYANLLLEYHPDWTVERKLLNDEDCRFIRDPSLTLFATGKLGLCCLDLDGTATFGSIGDYPSLAAAVDSPEARRMFAELSNGVATSKGCQICLSTGTRQCGPGSGGVIPAA